MPALQPMVVRRLALAAGLLDLVLFVAAAGAAIRLVMPATPPAPGTVAVPERRAAAAVGAPAAPAPGPAGRTAQDGGAPGSLQSRSGAGTARAAALILERGLFGRPEPAGAAASAGSGLAAGATEASQPAAPLPVLVGTAVGPAAYAAAVFADGRGGQFLVGIGEPIDDNWRLVAVERGMVVVEDQDGRQQDLAVPLPE